MEHSGEAEGWRGVENGKDAVLKRKPDRRPDRGQTDSNRRRLAASAINNASGARRPSSGDPIRYIPATHGNKKKKTTLPPATPPKKKKKKNQDIVLKQGKKE